ncbi:hypothetical protein H8F10_13725 [Vibrio fluvialis]|uniref:ribosome-inactivating family protein n=1 Tax=Vibrio fluvialis TaxID=676 RepID=UPI00192B52F9|nr:ribosome-inactivating family protein [Vibrio fluvialis]MBL4278974.1 hypothetical protein [Vibrio fluvialis]
MKRFIILIFLITATTFSYANTNSCTYKFKVEDRQEFPQNKLSEFLEQEVRTKLNRDFEHFDIHIIKECADDRHSFELDMLSNNLYILGINGHKLPDDVVKYTDDPLEISEQRFEQAVDDALNFDELSFKQKQMTLKMFAFVISEAARFKDVENAVNNAFTTQCSYAWNDYSDLLRRWKTMSIFANTRGIAKGKQYIGGSRAFLIAPITEDIVDTYNKAVTSGWQVTRYDYDKRQSDHAVTIGEATCSL